MTDIKSEISKMNSRARRNYFTNPKSERPFGAPKSGKNRFTGDLLPGEYAKDGRIVLNEDGSVTFSNKVFFDDILAFVLFAVEGNPTLAASIKNQLRVTIEAADERAVAKHGYDASPEERDAGWTNHCSNN